MNEQRFAASLREEAMRIPVSAAPVAEAQRAGERAKRRQRAVIVYIGAALTSVAIVGGLVMGQTGGTRPTVGPSSQGPSGSAVGATLYLTHLAPNAAHIVPVHVEDAIVPDPDAVLTALLTYEPGSPDLANAFSGAVERSGIEPTAEVSVSGNEISLRLTDLPSDLLNGAAFSSCPCPSGALLAQQLVWTVQVAVGEQLPVTVFLDGVPLETLAGQALKWPMSGDTQLLSPGAYPMTADGRTFGTVRDAVQNGVLVESKLPELVAVGDQWEKPGYADSRLVVGGADPGTGAAAGESSATATVYAIDGSVLGEISLDGGAGATP